MSNTAPGWAEQPTTKKKNTGAKISCGCLSLVGLAVIGIIAVALAGNSGSTHTGSGNSGTLTSSSNKGNPPTHDVRLSDCTIDPTLGWPSVTVTLTNHSSQTSNYIVQVEFTDRAGTRLSSGMAAENNVQPGQKVISHAQGADTVQGAAITCKVNKVDRYASAG